MARMPSRWLGSLIGVWLTQEDGIVAFHNDGQRIGIYGF